MYEDYPTASDLFEWESTQQMQGRAGELGSLSRSQEFSQIHQTRSISFGAEALRLDNSSFPLH